MHHELLACYAGGIRDVPTSRAGEMAEWLKAHAWKACLGETLTWVRIPLSPPETIKVLRPGNGLRISARGSDAAKSPQVRIPLSPPVVFRLTGNFRPKTLVSARS